MAYKIIMLLLGLLVPAAMLVGGYLMYRVIPKNRNGYIGYRSTMSRKNENTWAFAQRYCGKLWLKAGSIMLALSAIILVLFWNMNEDAFSILTMVLEGVQIFGLLCTIHPVEKALRKTFDEKGNRC